MDRKKKRRSRSKSGHEKHTWHLRFKRYACPSWHLDPTMEAVESCRSPVKWLKGPNLGPHAGALFFRRREVPTLAIHWAGLTQN